MTILILLGMFKFIQFYKRNTVYRRGPENPVGYQKNWPREKKLIGVAASLNHKGIYGGMEARVFCMYTLPVTLIIIEELITQLPLPCRVGNWYPYLHAPLFHARTDVLRTIMFPFPLHASEWLVRLRRRRTIKNTQANDKHANKQGPNKCKLVKDAWRIMHVC